MIIAEQFVKGKHDEATCEDGIVATAHFVAAIDGSTSKGVRRVDPEKSNGRLCMEVVADYIRHMDAETSLDDFCEGVTKAIHDIYVERGFTGSEPMAPVDRLCASAVVYSQRRQEVWMIGDCQCIVGGELHANTKPRESLIAKKRAEAFNAMASAHADMIDHGELVRSEERRVERV